MLTLNFSYGCHPGNVLCPTLLNCLWESYTSPWGISLAEPVVIQTDHGVEIKQYFPSMIVAHTMWNCQRTQFFIVESTAAIFLSLWLYWIVPSPIWVVPLIKRGEQSNCLPFHHIGLICPLLWRNDYFIQSYMENRGQCPLSSMSCPLSSMEEREQSNCLSPFSSYRIVPLYGVNNDLMQSYMEDRGTMSPLLYGLSHLLYGLNTPVSVQPMCMISANEFGLPLHLYVVIGLRNLLWDHITYTFDKINHIGSCN